MGKLSSVFFLLLDLFVVVTAFNATGLSASLQPRWLCILIEVVVIEVVYLAFNALITYLRKL